MAKPASPPKPVEDEETQLRTLALKAATMCQDSPSHAKKSCEPAREWASDPRLKERGSAELLFRILEDEQVPPGARHYVVDALDSHPEWASDAAFVGRYLALVERPSYRKSGWYDLANLVAKIDVASDVFPRIKAILQQPSDSLFLGKFLGKAIAKSPGHFLPMALRITAQPPSSDVIAAVEAVGEAVPALPAQQQQEVCRFLLSWLGDKSYPREARGDAADALLGCPSVDRALDLVSTWAKSDVLGEGGLGVMSLLSSTVDLSENPRNKQKALAITRVILANRNNDTFTRVYALEVLVKADPQGKALLKRHANEPEPMMREKIAELQAQP